VRVDPVGSGAKGFESSVCPVVRCQHQSSQSMTRFSTGRFVDASDRGCRNNSQKHCLRHQSLSAPCATPLEPSQAVLDKWFRTIVRQDLPSTEALAQVLVVILKNSFRRSWQLRAGWLGKIPTDFEIETNRPTVKVSHRR